MKMVDALASDVLPVAAEHVQVLERLRQLTAWQQAQQERLRRHQQEQIAWLRGEPDVQRSQLAPGSVTRLEQVCVAYPGPEPQSFNPLSSSYEHTLPLLHRLDDPSTRPTVGGGDSGWTSQNQLAPAWDERTQDDQLPEQPEDPLSSAVSVRGEGTRTAALLGGRGGESDSGLETGGQGSEEETPQGESAGSDDSDLAGGRQRGARGSSLDVERPIQPGVGV